MRLAMFSLALAAAVAATAGYGADRIDPRRQTAAAKPIAANMLVYHHAVVAYARQNPSATGPVPESSLALPSWYRKAGSWASIIGAGHVIATYSTTPLPSPMSQNSLAAALAATTAGDILTGLSVAAGGPIYSPTGATTATPPAGVPSGVAVALSIAS